MTVVNAVYITGCKEIWGPTMVVDLDEPERVGESMFGGLPFCYIEDNHLEMDVELEAKATNKVIYDEEGRKTAGVTVICHEKRCPLNIEYSPDNTERLHINPDTLIGEDIRKLRPEVIDYIISDGKNLEETIEGYALNQLVTSFKQMKDNMDNFPEFRSNLADEKRWIFTGSTPPSPDASGK